MDLSQSIIMVMVTIIACRQRPLASHSPFVQKRALPQSAMTKTSKGQGRWNTADDAKLIELWRIPHNGVDPTKLDNPTVKAIHEKYWPDKRYSNFAPLYRGKARSFNVSLSLDGHRKRKFHVMLQLCRTLLSHIACVFFLWKAHTP